MATPNPHELLISAGSTEIACNQNQLSSQIARNSLSPEFRLLLPKLQNKCVRKCFPSFGNSELKGSGAHKCTPVDQYMCEPRGWFSSNGARQSNPRNICGPPTMNKLFKGICFSDLLLSPIIPPRPVNCNEKPAGRGMLCSIWAVTFWQWMSPSFPKRVANQKGQYLISNTSYSPKTSVSALNLNIVPRSGNINVFRSSQFSMYRKREANRGPKCSRTNSGTCRELKPNSRQANSY